MKPSLIEAIKLALTEVEQIEFYNLQQSGVGTSPLTEEQKEKLSQYRKRIQEFRDKMNN